MIIANNLDKTERVFLPHKKAKNKIEYKWYDYVVFLGSLSIVCTALFLIVLVIIISMFG